MAEAIRTALRLACIRILRPIIRVLLEANVTAPELIEWVKLAFVEAARERLLQPDGTTSTDKIKRRRKDSQYSIWMVTGITRSDIRRIQRGSGTDLSEDRGRHRAQQVLAGWWNQEEFQSRSGRRPAILKRYGSYRSFEALCKKHSGEDQADTTILEELVRVGAARRLPKDRVQALRETFVTVKWAPSAIEEMGDDVSAHLETWLHNLLQPDDALLCTRVATSRVNPRAEGVVRKQLSLHLEPALAMAKQLVHNPKHSLPIEYSGESGDTLGVSCFIYRRLGNAPDLPVHVRRSSKASSNDTETSKRRSGLRQ